MTSMTGGTRPRIATTLATAWWIIPAIVALALALRLALILLLPQLPYSDAEWYLVRAGEMARGMGYQEAGHPTAFWPVGYPALLAGSMMLFGPSLIGPLLINLVSVVATILLILWFGRILTTQTLPGRLAALLYAVYPAHIVYSGQAMSETASVALTMGAMALLVGGRRRWPSLVAAGMLFGAVTLMRAQMLFFPAGVIVALLLVYRDMRVRDAARAGLLVYLALLAVVLPWSFRNEREMGTFALVSTNGGVALYTGANDQATGDWFAWEHTALWDKSGVPFAQRVERQVEMDQAFRRLSTEWIAAHPGRWIALGFRKMALVWRKDSDAFWSLDHSYPGAGPVWTMVQAADQIFYIIVAGLGLFGIAVGARAIVQRDWARAPLALMGCMPAFVTLTAFAFTGQVRYHHPAMPFLFIAAGWSLAQLLAWRQARVASVPGEAQPAY